MKALFQNMGRMFMEVAAIPAIDRAYVDRYVRIAPGSQERLDRELAKGKGVLFLTGHFGNWELIPVTGALYGYPTLVLAREQGWPKLNRMLTEYRESKGCRVVTKGFPVRDLIQGLKEGRIVGIVADQDGGKNGVLSPFFGRLASTAPGMIALALSTGAPVLPVFMVRTRGAEHSLIVEEPLEIPQGVTEQRRIQAGFDAYVKVVEKYIRRYPAQWLWLHRRWKTCPQKHILIFDDGKAGHFSQTRALAQRLQAAWKQRMAEDRRLDGRPEPLGTFEKAEVAFRHPTADATIAAFSTCEGPPRAPLHVLARRLFFGLKEREVVEQAPASLDGAEALRTVVRGDLEGTPVVVESVVARRGACVYDLVLAAAPGAYPALRPEFERVVSGWRALPAGR